MSLFYPKLLDQKVKKKAKHGPQSPANAKSHRVINTDDVFFTLPKKLMISKMFASRAEWKPLNVVTTATILASEVDWL